ncbi:MAG: winged helix-turn-helix transcriptional regulator [Nitrososphaerota archaeon]|nr:winged helix-turn-helix transcriptional regulator [Nitrososphaerota archaeon]MDG7023571.1 winged helix-turn-helix transcriptional regulator [Nitrososphaerota archaeon]
MRAFKFIRDPKAFELLGDETRRRMIYLLRAREMTVSQLAADLHLTTQAVYHQIGRLTKVGLVEVAREERHGHLIEAYYRATAEVFEFTHGEAGSQGAEKHFKEAFDALAQLGVHIDADSHMVAEVAAVNEKMDRQGLPRELEEKISGVDDVEFFTKSKMYQLARMALMSDKQFEKQISSLRELRDLMTKALVRKSVKG